MNSMTEIPVIPSDYEVFSQSSRLTIMLLLTSHKQAKFTEIQKLLKLSPGNLDHHLKKLEQLKYIRIYKKIFPTRPLTMIEITEEGKASFNEYLSILKEIISRANDTS